MTRFVHSDTAVLAFGTCHVISTLLSPDAFNKDTDSRKVSLGVGAYRGDDGKPYVLDSVRQAEKRVLDKSLNHEYAGIAGKRTAKSCAVGAAVLS